jgi:hypothetical protein
MTTRFSEPTRPGGFAAIWTATSAANLADGIVMTGLPLVVLAGGGSAGDVAAVTVALTIAWPVFGLFAGAIVDRWPAEFVAFAASAVRVALFSALALVLAADDFRIEWVIVAAAIYGVTETLVDTSLVALVPRSVPPAALTRANARIEGAITVTNLLVGPPLAGALIVIGSAAVVLPPAALAAVSAITLLLAHRRLARRQFDAPRRTGRLAGLAAGLAEVFRERRQRALTLLTASMNFIWGAWAAIFVVYAVAPGPLGLTSVAYGILLTGMAAGGILAAVVTVRLRRLMGTVGVLLLDPIGTLLLVAPAAFGAPLWLVAGGVVVAGVGSSVWRIVVATIRQQITPAELLGRVYAAARVISLGTYPLGAALAGALATLAGVGGAFTAASLVAAAVLVATVVVLPRVDLPR